MFDFEYRISKASSSFLSKRVAQTKGLCIPPHHCPCPPAAITAPARPAAIKGHVSYFVFIAVLTPEGKDMTEEEKNKKGSLIQDVAEMDDFTNYVLKRKPIRSIPALTEVITYWPTNILFLKCNF